MVPCEGSRSCPAAALTGSSSATTSNTTWKPPPTRYTSPYWEVVRARIVLYAADGLGNDEIAARLDTPRQVVSKWRKRFFEQRLAGLADLPRGGRPPVFPP